MKTLFKKQIAVVVAVASCSMVSIASAGNLLQSEFGQAVGVESINTTGGGGCPFESPDGLSLFIASGRAGGEGGLDIWAASRASLDSDWSVPGNLGYPINTVDNDFCPTPTAGRELLFVSNRAADCSGGNIYLSRQSPVPTEGWDSPMLLGCAQDGGPNFNDDVFSPSLVATKRGTYLFYSSFGEIGDHDIYVSELSDDGSFGPGQRVDALSNLGDDDRMPNIRHLGHNQYEVVFSSTRSSWGRRNQPAYGGQDVYRAVSRRMPLLWSEPVNLGSGINTDESETRATLSADGKRLYFGRSGSIYVSER